MSGLGAGTPSPASIWGYAKMIHAQQLEHGGLMSKDETRLADDEVQKGPEFMSIRWNVRRKRRILRDQLKPLENYFLDEIMEGTLNAWKTENEFDLKELATLLNTGVNRVYAMRKKLAKMGIIVQKPTRYKGREILGLNPTMFGQILTDRQHTLESQKLIPISPNRDTTSPNRDKIHPERDTPDPNRDKNETQVVENITEIPPIDSSRLYRSFRVGSFKFSEEESKPKHDKVLSVKWLRETNGEISFDEWNKNRSAG